MQVHPNHLAIIVEALELLANIQRKRAESVSNTELRAVRDAQWKTTEDLLESLTSKK